MKTMSLNFIGMVALALGIMLSFTQCQKDQETQEMLNYRYEQRDRFYGGGPAANPSTAGVDVCECLVTNFAMETLNEAEEEALLFMREEEKLARDVYRYLYQKYNYPVFYNIGLAEERHMQAVLCLINRYGLTDPVGENAPGVFVNQRLTDLYTALIQAGGNGLAEALTVGATIEDLDIADLIAMMEGGEIDNADIRTVFNELTKGSRNHLRAFVKMLTRTGYSYEPQYITAEYFEQIINSERETGGEICAGIINCPFNGNQGDCPGDGTGICPGDCTGSGPMHQQYRKGGPN